MNLHQSSFQRRRKLTREIRPSAIRLNVQIVDRILKKDGLLESCTQQELVQQAEIALLVVQHSPKVLFQVNVLIKLFPESQSFESGRKLR